MTKADFIDWKRHPVTQQVFSQLYARVEDLKEQLAHQAGEDPHADAKKSGAILAFKEFLDIEYIEESHGN